VVTVFELAHVELAHGGALLLAVGNPVDGEAARTANAFATIALERDGLFTVVDQVLVDDIEHLEERRVLADADGVRLELPGLAAAVLTPDLEREIEVFRHRLVSPHLYER
jgi:hypothetical protein